MDTESSPFSELSDDLLVEIISLVPFKSTRCCMCVCRRWRDVISHPDHRNKLPGSTLAGFFYKTGDLGCQLMNYKTGDLGCQLMNRHYGSLTGNWCSVDPTLSFLPKYRRCDINIDILDCRNGLLLCRRQVFNDYRKVDYVVCNPATKRWVVVPGTNWSSKAQVARLGFDPVVSSHFHVFEFGPLDEYKNMLGIEYMHIKPLGIYSSKAGVWTHPTDWDCSIDMDNFSGSTFFSGELYLCSYGDKVVAAIDVEGNCRVIPIPTSHGSSVSRDVFASHGQLYLAISSSADSELSIWVLEDSNTDNWTLKHNVSRLELFGAQDSFYAWIENVIIHPEHNVILIFFTKFYNSRYRSVTKLMSYDMDSRKVHSIYDLGYDCRSPYFSYAPLFSHSLADEH